MFAEFLGGKRAKVQETARFWPGAAQNGSGKIFSGQAERSAPLEKSFLTERGSPLGRKSLFRPSRAVRSNGKIFSDQSRQPAWLEKSFPTNPGSPLGWKSLVGPAWLPGWPGKGAADAPGDGRPLDGKDRRQTVPEPG